MATSSRDVKLTLSVDTLGEEGIKELQKAVEALGRDGSAAAPEFQRLADEIGRLGEQSQALTTFRELSEETDKLATRQAESSATTAQMAERLEVLRAATESATQRQREATAAYNAGDLAQKEATANLRLLKAEYDAAGKNTAEYRNKLVEAVRAQNDANVALTTLRQQQKAANAEVGEAASAQGKLETQYKKSAAQAEKLDAALRKQNEALREAATAAEALGVSTEDIAAAEGKLLTTLQAGVTTVNARTAAIQEMIEADRLLAIEEQAMAALLARGKVALDAEAAAQRDAALAVEQYTAAKKAAVAAVAWQQEAEQVVNLAHATQQLAREAQVLAAVQAELAGQNAFEKQAAASQELIKAAQYVKFWEQALQEAETQVTETANAAQRAAERIDNAFGTLGVRSVEAIQTEIKQTRAAMETLASTATQTGAQLSGAFTAGENKIKALERELRELTGTLTTADKAADLFKNSLGQIAAGNLVADAIGSIVEKVKDMGRQFIASVVQLDTFRRALNAVYKDAGTTASQLDFLRKTAGDSGVSVGGLSDSFVKFSAAMKSANVPVAQSNALFASLTRAAGTLGLGAERTSLALDALAQIASKGVLSMEELRQQLGDSLPGALSLTAKGLGITDAELVKLVESGKLASRDFFPAFTKGLKELQGETEGLTPTWERLKNSLVIGAQNIGDAGGIQVMTAALKALTATVGIVIGALSGFFETLGLVGKGLALLGPGLGSASERMAMFKEEVAAAAERQAKFSAAIDASLSPMVQQNAVMTQATTTIVANVAASDNLTRAQQAAAIAAKLNGDATLEASAKYVQLSIATASLITQQQNETLNLERVAKARKEEGDTLVALAKQRGEEQGILKASLQAAEEYAVAVERITASKQAELDIQELQLVAQLEKLEADKATATEIEKATEKLKESIKTKAAEIEQMRAAASAARAEAEARRLAAQTYADNSARVKEYTAEMNRLKVVLAEYERLNLQGKKTDAEVAAVRKQLADVTALQKDSVADLVKNMQAEAAASVVSLQAKQSALAIDAQIAQASANIARLRGDNTLAMQYEREAMTKQIEIAKIKIEIDRVQAQLQIEILKLQREQLAVDDALYQQKLKEINLKIKLQEITLKEIDGGTKLIRLKETENALRQQANNGLGGEALARGNVTEASERQADAMAKMLMQYTLSADYSERQIAILEREAAAEERLAEARRKRLNVDKEGYSLNTEGQRVLAGETDKDVADDTAKLYGEENRDNEKARRARQLRALGRLRSQGNGMVVQNAYSADELRELQQLEAELLNGGTAGQRPGTTSSVTPAAVAAAGAAASLTEQATKPKAGGAGVSGGGTKTMNINLNGKPVGTIQDLNDQQSAQVLTVFRAIESAKGTSA